MVMRLIKKIKRFFFGIHEIIWVVVHEIENWLYPYCDRPVDDIFQDDEEGVDESSYLHSQIESANQRIERLQDVGCCRKYVELLGGRKLYPCVCI